MREGSQVNTENSHRSDNCLESFFYILEYRHNFEHASNYFKNRCITITIFEIKSQDGFQGKTSRQNQK